MNKKIVCFGDSNTWGFIPGTGERYPPETRWTNKLAMLTGNIVIEEGLSGRTSAFADPIWPWCCGADYIEACVCSHDPFDLLIIMLGTNDMKTYVCNCLDASAKGVAKLAAMARNALERPDLKVLIISPIQISDKCFEMEDIMLQLDADSVFNMRILPQYLKEQAELNNYYFMDAAEYAEPSDVDAVHLDAAGHTLLANAIAAKVDEIFGE